MPGKGGTFGEICPASTDSRFWLAVQDVAPYILQRGLARVSPEMWLQGVSLPGLVEAFPNHQESDVNAVSLRIVEIPGFQRSSWFSL